MSIGSQLVVGGRGRGGDGFVERVLGQVDLAEHPQRSSQHSERPAEQREVVGGSRLDRDLAGLAGYLRGIVADRRGQPGQGVRSQVVHVAMVRLGPCTRFTRIPAATR